MSFHQPPRRPSHATKDSRSVVFSPGVLQTVSSHRQRWRRKEAGGILLGRLSARRIVVESASEPGPGDRAGRYFFERGARRAQEIINAAWQESDGEVIYLGEWHTHPEAQPSPSPRDRAMIREMWEGTRQHHDSLLLFIVGTHGMWLGQQNAAGLWTLGNTRTLPMLWTVSAGHSASDDSGV